VRSNFLPYYRPSIDETDMRSVTESMRNGWLTTGPKVREFEARFAAASGVKHAVAVSSCTAGLLLGMIALGVKAGDEVIMPSLTFVAGAQCARQLGARPVFADIDPHTLCITAATVGRVLTPRTKLIMPMHYGGYPADIAGIVALARRHGIAVFEDAAHAAGMVSNRAWAGSGSDGAAYSFYATKNLATAEGGMVLTNRDDVMESARIHSLHGMDRDAWKRYTQGGKWRYDVTVTGHKFNLPDICAALGLAQLDRLSVMQARRDEIAAEYGAALAGLEGVTPVMPPLGAHDRHAWCMYVVRVDEQSAGISRDAFIDALAERNIGTSVHYIPTHLFSAFAEHAGDDLPVTNAVWPQLVSLPLFPGLTPADQADVIAAVRDVVRGPRVRPALVHVS
jgi:dTDP-4-amino-4,6-dideoxygalactose transaminase